jgi:hypothetical protein
MSTQQKLEKLESKAQKVDQKLDNEVTKLKKPKGQVHYPFWFGGSAASMAAVCTHPLDLSTPLTTRNSSVHAMLTARSKSAPTATRCRRTQNHNLYIQLHTEE